MLRLAFETGGLGVRQIVGNDLQPVALRLGAVGRNVEPVGHAGCAFRPQRPLQTLVAYRRPGGPLTNKGGVPNSAFWAGIFWPATATGVLPSTSAARQGEAYCGAPRRRLTQSGRVSADRQRKDGRFAGDCPLRNAYSGANADAEL